MSEIKKGDIVEGSVFGIQKYGVFVKMMNGYKGLIHISEISNKFVKNINDFVNIGENINVEIKEIDRKNKKCKLSIKNIDYIKLENNGKIIESGEGFDKLKKKLPVWIEEKCSEINQNNMGR